MSLEPESANKVRVAQALHDFLFAMRGHIEQYPLAPHEAPFTVTINLDDGYVTRAKVISASSTQTGTSRALLVSMQPRKRKKR